MEKLFLLWFEQNHSGYRAYEIKSMILINNIIKYEVDITIAMTYDNNEVETRIGEVSLFDLVGILADTLLD